MFWALIDPLYIIILAPGLALSLYATFRTKSTFSKYSQVGSLSGMTGAQAAAHMLKRHGVTDVRIERSSGWLSDHYDPSQKALRLSDDVYSSQSLSAIGVACHEAGHAMQDAHGYAMLSLRTATCACNELRFNFRVYCNDSRIHSPGGKSDFRRCMPICDRCRFFVDNAAC